MCLRVVATGDLNAVDIAQETHRAMLSEAGCMSEEVVLQYDFPAPRGPIWEGLYTDDHVVIALVKSGKGHRLQALGRPMS